MALTAITGAQIFDGEKTTGVQTVVIDGGRIARVGGDAPQGSEIVDGSGATLLPGLIDAHVHSAPGSLALALRFGVTTELEMQGMNTRENRRPIADDDTLADVRSSGFAITPPGGHPSELMPEGFRPKWDLPPVMPLMPFSSTPAEAAAFVPQLLARGSDFIKFMIDDGSVEGHPGLPSLDQATVNAGVAEAKRYGALTVAHALTAEATRMAAEAGIDGVTHVFMDQPHTAEIISIIKDAGMFVIPCITLNASMMGITGSKLADDPRVAARLDSEWDRTLRSSYNRYPQGKLDDVYATVHALDAAGVDVLAGPTSPCSRRSSVAWHTERACTTNCNTWWPPASLPNGPCVQPLPPQPAASTSVTGAASPKDYAPTSCWSTETRPTTSATPSTPAPSGAAAPAWRNDRGTSPGGKQSTVRFLLTAVRRPSAIRCVLDPELDAFLGLVRGEQNWTNLRSNCSNSWRRYGQSGMNSLSPSVSLSGRASSSPTSAPRRCQRTGSWVDGRCTRCAARLHPGKQEPAAPGLADAGGSPGRPGGAAGTAGASCEVAGCGRSAKPPSTAAGPAPALPRQRDRKDQVTVSHAGSTLHA